MRDWILASEAMLPPYRIFPSLISKSKTWGERHIKMSSGSIWGEESKQILT